MESLIVLLILRLPNVPDAGLDLDHEDIASEVVDLRDLEQRGFRYGLDATSDQVFNRLLVNLIPGSESNVRRLCQGYWSSPCRTRVSRLRNPVYEHAAVGVQERGDILAYVLGPLMLVYSWPAPSKWGETPLILVIKM